MFPLNRTPGSLPHHPWAMLLVVALIVVEYLWYRAIRREGFDLKESAVSLGIAVGRLLLRGLSLGLLLPLYQCVYAHRLFTIPVTGLVSGLALFLVAEFFYYWFHRASHTVRWMWATHAVHHSPTQLNLSAAYRLGWTDTISGDWLFFLIPMWIGFRPPEVLAMLGANLTYQFFLHTRLVPDLGPLEWLFNTPAHHRVHHARNEGCLDRNYGGVLIVFDRLFGTFAKAPADERLQYGLVARAPTLNPFAVAFGEWIAMFRDWRAASGSPAKFLALFGRPGAGTVHAVRRGS